MSSSEERARLLDRLVPSDVEEAERTPLTVEQRRTITTTFRALLEGVYAHLPQKRASYGFDPSQRLRLLGERAADAALTDDAFHREMAQIVTDLRDAHTRYLAPRSNADDAMFLPLLVERYTGDDGLQGYVASKVVALTAAERRQFKAAGFESGVELTHWNGVRIERAVELQARHDTGGRPDTQIARALETLTMRPLRYALPPDEDWVIVNFRTKRGAEREVRIEWRQVHLSPAKVSANGHVDQALAYDPIADSAREVKKMLFAGPVWLAEQVAAEGVPPQAIADCIAAGWADDKQGWLAGRFAANVAAREVPGAGRTYGYLRIYSFQLYDDQGFIEEVIEMLGHLPQDGLIIDVRSNPGGLIWAAEGLLQLFTPNHIEPTRFSTAATDMTRAMTHAAQNRQLQPWADSLDAAVSSGATHSRAIPLSSSGRCNNVGQVYGGPVVAIVDALTYSAGDLFAAGFVDNEVGKLICTSAATGGGGANVWRPEDVDRALSGTGHELADLGDVSYTIAFRRATRAGQNGDEIEDTGVAGSFRHELTRRDLTDRNADLIAYAAGLLSSETTTGLSASIVGDQVEVLTRGLDRVTIEIDGVPVASRETIGDIAVLPLVEQADQHQIEIVGYANTQIRQRRRLTE